MTRLAFYYPMFGLINLFISILKSPMSPTSQSDVTLLDSAAGHFAHLEFITSSELAFPFAREVANLAREAVKRARERGEVDGNENAWDHRVWTGAPLEYWNDVSLPDLPFTYITLLQLTVSLAGGYVRSRSRYGRLEYLLGSSSP
jgi:hypothetical protein